jgi:putative flippase GtrA
MVTPIRSLIERYAQRSGIRQFIKFAAVGFMNSIVDFSIINALSAFTHIFSGPFIILFNVISFSVAVTNSYFFNKRWTFRQSRDGTVSEFLGFILVNIGGVLLNTSIVFFFTTFVPPFAAVHPQAWLNIGKIIALPVSTFWNFFGMKFFIFKRKLAPAQEKTTP